MIPESRPENMPHQPKKMVPLVLSEGVGGRRGVNGPPAVTLVLKLGF